MSAVTKPTQSEISENSSLPNSRRVYSDGQLPGVHVPFREITQSPSRNFDGTLVANPPKSTGFRALFRVCLPV